MKQIEILDWAIAGVVARMQQTYLTQEERDELERELQILARLFVVEKYKDEE
jgi:hypothetical protein